MREQRIRLYIIQGVPEDTLFIPRTRKEISVSKKKERKKRERKTFGSDLFCLCSKSHGLSWMIYLHIKRLNHVLEMEV